MSITNDKNIIKKFVKTTFHKFLLIVLDYYDTEEEKKIGLKEGDLNKDDFLNLVDLMKNKVNVEFSSNEIDFIKNNIGSLTKEFLLFFKEMGFKKEFKRLRKEEEWYIADNILDSLKKAGNFDYE